jgi:tRNA wybutosine-synthesizing protein 3
MPVSSFLQRKSAVLSKLDKSSAGKWDKKIVSLCEKINISEEFYTTSSCSGRIVLMLDQERKSPNLFLRVWHESISLSELKKFLKENSEKGLIKFKLEPPILHIACKDLEVTSRLLEKANHNGFKRSGILSAGRNIVLELNSTERLEFPILNKGKILVDEPFLELVVKQANQKLKKGWERIEKLRKVI